MVYLCMLMNLCDLIYYFINKLTELISVIVFNLLVSFELHSLTLLLARDFCCPGNVWAFYFNKSGVMLLSLCFSFFFPHTLLKPVFFCVCVCPVCFRDIKWMTCWARTWRCITTRGRWWDKEAGTCSINTHTLSQSVGVSTTSYLIHSI